MLASLDLEDSKRRIFEICCGNGASAAHLATLGYRVVGVDTSESGIAQANDQYPSIDIERGSAYDALASATEVSNSAELRGDRTSIRSACFCLPRLWAPGSGGTLIMSTTMGT